MSINRMNSLAKYELIASIRIDVLSQIIFSRLQLTKLAWTFFMLSAFSFCCFLITHSVAEYTKFHVDTKVSLRSELKSRFPTISICSMYPLNTDYYLHLFNEAHVNVDSDPYYSLLTLELLHKQNTGSYFTAAQKKAMFDVDGFVISCTFPENKPCNMSQLRHFFFPLYLNCVQFNSGYDKYDNRVPIYDAHVGGTHDTLAIEVYIGLPDQLSQAISTRQVYVYVTEANDDPFKKPAAITLTPGFETQLVLKKNVFSQYNAWPYLYSTCNVNADGTLIQPIEDRTLFDYALSTNFTYSQDSCLLYCFQHYNIQKCACAASWDNYRNDGSYEKCLTPEERKCSHNFYYKEFNVGDFIVNNCLDKCPLECNLERFDIYQSVNAHPDPASLEKKLRTNPILLSHYSNQTDFRENLLFNVVKFSVSYDTLAYMEVIEEAKMSSYTLLASLGGHFHLCFGMSLLSFVEIIDIFLQLVCFHQPE